MNGREIIERLHDGRRVFASALVSTSPLWPGIAKQVGLDFVFVDTEHTPIGREKLSHLCQAYQAMGLPPVVRLPCNDPFEACKALDAGAGGIIGPYLETAEQARGLVGAVKMVPNYHRYDVYGESAVALAKRASSAGLGICVQVRILDERAHHPLMQVPGVPVEGIARLAQAVPDARFLACGVYQSELAGLAGAPNVAVELSSIESGDALATALAVIGPRRRLLGTHAPVYDPAPAVAKVRGVTEHATIAARVGRSNANDFFGATQDL